MKSKIIRHCLDERDSMKGRTAKVLRWQGVNERKNSRSVLMRRSELKEELKKYFDENE
jgi:hypothetical protein